MNKREIIKKLRSEKLLLANMLFLSIEELIVEDTGVGISTVAFKETKKRLRERAIRILDN